MKVSIVVLHYLDWKTTIDCLINLQNLESQEDIDIIMVDNGSNNGSFDIIKNQFNNKNFHFIKSEQNLGFAKGNNLGYIYARSKLNPDIIVVINNDVMIFDTLFCMKLQKYKDFDIIGPDIVNLKGNHQNPFRQKIISGKSLFFRLIYRYCSYAFYRIPLLGRLKSKHRIFPSKDTDNKIISENNFSVVLHGSAVVYGRRWIEEETFAFFPDTFLYGEEDVLFEWIIQKGYKSVYASDIEVIHQEDKSTNMIVRSSYSKYLFIHKHSLDSTIILYKLRKKTKRSGIKYYNGVRL